jgi:hypothetical protein
MMSFGLWSNPRVEIEPVIMTINTLPSLLVANTGFSDTFPLSNAMSPT